VGQRYVVLFMEAESEDELHEMLGQLPLSELGDTSVTQLKSFEELQHPQRAPRAPAYRNRTRRSSSQPQVRQPYAPAAAPWPIGE